MEFKHKSVLLGECIENLNIKSDGVYIDATMGGAGHSAEICKRLSKQGMFIGVDRDREAFDIAKKRLSEYDCRKQFVNDNFSALKNHISEKADGILADLGVSSYQLDNADRGFTYRYDAYLDMRMNPDSDFSAYDVVNGYGFDELSRIIKDYGEEKFARSIARSIVEARKVSPIKTTGELVEIIRNSLPAKSIREKHPAKRTFQAIRIEVNSELDSLQDGLKCFFEILKPGGRLCIITFHSLEDRIVKEYFRSLIDVCTCPKDFPVCVCGNVPKAKYITRKPIIPSAKELVENPRSKSAHLRVIEKL